MAQLKKILLVDDDDDLREALSEQLVMTEDFDVFEADDGASAMTKAKESIYDLIILDVGLPDTDGRELCRLMRKQGVKCPIVMLTAQDSDADTIYGLDAGANDYVSKPFKFPVLLARIRSQLRSAADELSKLYTAADDEEKAEGKRGSDGIGSSSSSGSPYTPALLMSPDGDEAKGAGQGSAAALPTATSRAPAAPLRVGGATSRSILVFGLTSVNFREPQMHPLCSSQEPPLPS